MDKELLSPLQSRYLEGNVLLVDKPLEWTSFDVVNKIRTRLKYDLGLRKIKVGHAGTLDPLATGLLIVCTGKETKNIDNYQALVKEYTGEIKLGATTPSFDAETEVDHEYEWKHVKAEDVQLGANEFIGLIDQEVPVFSATKIDGMRSYKLARSGQTVRRKSRKVEIYEFEITDVSLPYVTFRVVCSKGTYIRALANDLGKSLQSGGYLTKLRRTRIGAYQVKDAWTIEGWLDKFAEEVSRDTR